MFKKTAVLLTVLICVFAANLYAEKVIQADGVSVTFEDNWVVLTKSEKQQMTKDLEYIYDKFGEIDFNQFAVAAYDLHDADSMANLNIIVSPGKLNLYEFTLDEIESMLKTEYKKIGLDPKNMIAKRAKLGVGNYESVTISYEASSPITDEPIQQFQAMIPGKKETFIVTCTATKRTYEKYQEIFDKILASFEI